MNDQNLTEAEIADLRCLAGVIIPSSAKHGVPGADDDTIFSDIVNSIARDRDEVRAALARLRTLAGGSLAALDIGRRREVATRLRAEGGASVGVLTRVGTALLLPRRSGDGFARPGGAAAFPQRARARTGRLVLARPSAGPEPLLALGVVRSGSRSA